MYNDINEVSEPSNFIFHKAPVIIKSQYMFTCDNRIYFSETDYRDLIDHTYHFTLEVESPINTYGLAIDFFDIDDIFYQYIFPQLEGALLNNTLPDMNTTAENIVAWLWKQFEAHLPEENHVHRIELAETDQHSVVLEKT